CASPSSVSDLDDHLARRRQSERVAAEQHRRGAMLLDQGRARNAASGAEILAPVDRTGDGLAGIVEVNLARLARFWRAMPAQGRKSELRALADQGEPHVDHLDRLVGRVMGVALLV